MSVCEEYSGILINSNQTPVSQVTLPIEEPISFPANFQYGEGSEIRYPEISGFSLLCSIKSNEKAFQYELKFKNNLLGTILLANGTTSHSILGERIWVDTYFANPISVQDLEPVNQTLAPELILSIKAAPENSITEVWQSAISPSKRVNLRILALIADSGTDFLGNPYRSIVI